MANDNTALIVVGGIAVGLYIFKDKIAGLFSGVQATGDAVGSVATTTADAANSWIDLFNLKKDVSALQNAFSGMDNRGYYALTPGNPSQPIGVSNSDGDVIGVKSGTLGLSLLKTGNSTTSRDNYSQSWLNVSPTNTQTIRTQQTASQAISMAQNPYVKNVAIPVGNSALINVKPVSLPPSLLSVVTGRY